MKGFNEWPKGAGLSLSLGYEPNFKQSLFVCKHVTDAYKTPAGVTAVSDNTRPALSKTFRDFGFFYDVNQTVTIASTMFVNKGGNNEQKLQK